MSRQNGRPREQAQGSSTQHGAGSARAERFRRKVRKRAEQLAGARGDELLEGTVRRKAQGHYWVESNGAVRMCEISSTLRKELALPEADPTSAPRFRVTVSDIRAVDPVAVGDRVRYVEAAGERGMIVQVLPRRTRLSRRAAGKKPLEQVVVANVDQVIPLFAAARPEPKWGLLDRYLADAELAGLPAVICITKVDLVRKGALDDVANLYRGIGYRVVLTSAAAGAGLDELRDVLRGKLSVLTGKSGVGKSTLLNALEPDLELPVDDVSRGSGKGRHTTTHLEMHRLSFGAEVVDTPGMREFGLWNLGDRDPAVLFPEMRPFLGHCRFHPCSHSHEPGCPVREAVEAGAIAESRYQSYLRIRADHGG